MHWPRRVTTAVGATAATTLIAAALLTPTTVTPPPARADLAATVGVDDVPVPAAAAPALTTAPVAPPVRPAVVAVAAAESVAVPTGGAAGRGPGTGVPVVTLQPWGDPAVVAAAAAAQADAAAAGVTQSIAVVDRASGAVAQTDNATRPIGAMSTVKLLIAAEVLHRNGGEDGVPSADRALLHAMITRSDNAAASTLYARYGGRTMLQAVVARHGLTGTTPGSDWGSSTTTARDLAQLLTDVDRDPQVGPALFAEMSQTVAWTDGTRQDYGVNSVSGDHGAKQGYGYAADGTLLIHSAGYAAGRIIVIMSWTAHGNLAAAYDTSDATARAVSSAG